jgi:hypothetical protein
MVRAESSAVYIAVGVVFLILAINSKYEEKGEVSDVVGDLSRANSTLLDRSAFPQPPKSVKSGRA